MSLFVRYDDDRHTAILSDGLEVVFPSGVRLVGKKFQGIAPNGRGYSMTMRPHMTGGIVRKFAQEFWLHWPLTWPAGETAPARDFG